ncbi:ECF-type riboflavin transporter substrate-binding protein [Streptococcus loxodontisalivarius]|uniref:UPF0397 protein JOC28_001928 n=1 Tax=Streptococcus loxodontisalivarius TaxID=1349415 RepID=A0ABS2PU84_9STRE|nr:ECF-type riboflavin transporter substrate-binding protein [Streptococcus loxodontisalivarius]MBM7643617.1 energy-coupling factor transport system substrate-specific component [Streptococcus loxodontisalivarius]
MKQNSNQIVVATGIGAALFVIIGMFINIPIFGNTSIQLQYAVQALFSVIFGPVAGFLIGFIGHALKDGIQYGSISWAWVLASGVIGLVIGLFRSRYNVTLGKFTPMQMVWFNLVQILAMVIAYGVVTPVGDKLQYAQDWSYLYAQGAVAGLSNALTIAIAGTILMSLYANTRTQAGSLSKD